MSEWISYQNIRCPYCGENFEVELDTSSIVADPTINTVDIGGPGGSVKYIEDCYVCCRPIEIQFNNNSDSGSLQCSVGRLDE